ncbi:MAG: hypothetical protein NZ811_00075 [Gammaproteobacteria bacterium]|nr:hypothetical protein [Gammaproteobacteria bacterium]
MGCSTNIVPGFSETSKIKNRGLEMKVEQLLSKNKSKPKYPETAKVGDGIIKK